MAEGIRAPNLPLGSTVSEFLGIETTGSTKSLKRFLSSAVTGGFDSRIAALEATALTNGLLYKTRSQLYADGSKPQYTMAQVRGDSTPAYNGVYQKGLGSVWTRVADLPDAIVELSPAGGTSNAIIASPVPQLPASMEQKIYLLTIATTNTDAVTLSIDGGVTFYPIKSQLDTSLAADTLLGGTQAWLTFKNDKFSLAVSANPDASPILADAQAAAVTAVNAAASVNLPPVTADTMLVDNHGASAREAKTFAQVRTLLKVPSFDELPYVVASEHGVPGDSSDQTDALQAIADNLPSEGGNILYAGDVVINALDLHGRRNIRLIGLGGNGAGAGQRSRIITPAGAGGGIIIDCRATDNVAFSQPYLYAPNTAFDGVLLSYGMVDADNTTSNPSLDDFYVHVDGASATGLDLYGSYTGMFSRGTFAGAGKLVALQRVGGTGTCNGHKFLRANFNPKNQYPIVGSAEALSLDTCNFQAGYADGIGRAIQSSENYPMKGISLLTCGFYDVEAAGSQWVVISWGGGIEVLGGRISGYDGAGSSYGFVFGGHEEEDPYTGGVGGVEVKGMAADYLTAVVSLLGDRTKKSNVKGIEVGGNRLTNAAMFGGLGTADNVVNLGNRVYGNDLDFGSGFGLSGAPEYADRAAAVGAGLAEGRVFIATGVNGHRSLEIV